MVINRSERILPELMELNKSPGNPEKIQYRTIGSLISRARMEKKPLVLVEGKDDIPIYERLAKNIKKKVSIRAIEAIPGYSAGCEQVFNFINNAQEEILKSEDNQKFLLGIIDRDSRYDVNDGTNCLFILNKYSFESHYATTGNLYFALENFLGSSADFNKEVISYITEDVGTVLEKLYYCSLEAYKKICFPQYDNLVSFGSASYGTFKNQPNLVKKILEKKDELDLFAVEKGFNFKEDKRKYIKGKWIIDAFCDVTYHRIKKLSVFCENNTLLPGQKRCQFCEQGIPNTCSWKPRKNHTDVIFKNLMLQFDNEDEVGYIKERLLKLG